MLPSKRFLVISQTLIPAFWGYYSTRHQPESVGAREARIRVRLALQSLGPTFIKLGQLLSARPDLTDLALADELRGLLDQEAIIPFAAIQHVIEAESGLPLNKVFKTLDTQPIGSASIAQVHRGTLLSGTIVAVKVQRPHIDELIQADMPLLKRVCRLLDVLVSSKTITFSYLYDEFSDWIANELDFRLEGRRADKLRENMRNLDGVVIPRVYWQHTSTKVLIMSYEGGYTINALLDSMRQQNVRSIYDLKLEFKIDPDVVIRRIVAALARQALIDRYFHGDLHPANIIVQRSNRVAFVDFGIIGTINSEEHTQILLTLVALVQNDPEGLVKVFKALSATELTSQDMARIHEQLADELHKLQEDGAGKVSLNHFITLMFMLSRRYSLRLSRGYIIALKTIAQIDSVVGQIGLHEPLVTIMKPEVERCLIQSLTHELSKENVSTSLFNLLEAGKQLPTTLNEFESLVRSKQLLPISVTAPQKKSEHGLVVLLVLTATAIAAVTLWYLRP